MIPPGLYGAMDPQPFALHVHPTALVVADVHAHCDTCEVIGLLGGKWDAAAKTLRVLRAYPARRITEGDLSVNVELDPADEVILRECIANDGLVPVGWYHSHPSFPTVPSLIDLHNQSAYESVWASEGGQPFVALIVGPYRDALPRDAACSASAAWFHVRPGAEDLAERGMALVDAPCALSDGDVSAVALAAACKRAAAVHAQEATRVEWGDEAAGFTRSALLGMALRSRLANAWPAAEVDVLVDAVAKDTHALWYPDN